MAGATVLAARALTEGTERYDAIALVEASERLGASLHADAGWDAVTVGVDVPGRPAGTGARARRRGPAPADIPRVRGRAPARRAPERPPPGPGRPATTRRRGVRRHDLRARVALSPAVRRDARDGRATRQRRDLRRVYGRTLDPRRATLVVGGDLGGQDVMALAERLFGSWTPGGGRGRRRGARRSTTPGSTGGRLVRVIHRPGSVQTEIRIGHRGLPRRIDDFHAVSVMSAILGGLFNSRLNMKLREEKGYTYGAGAGFDMRRGAGPFSARAAVNTEVTVPAIVDTLAELTRMRDAPGRRVRARRGAGLPDRRLPAPVRDGRRGRRGARQPGRPRPRRRGARRLPRRTSKRSGSTPSRPRRGTTSTSTRRRSSWSATSTRSARPSRPPTSAGSSSSAMRRRSRPARSTRTSVPGPVDDEAETGPTAGAEEPSIPGIDDMDGRPGAGADDLERPDAGLKPFRRASSQGSSGRSIDRRPWETTNDAKRRQVDPRPCRRDGLGVPDGGRRAGDQRPARIAPAAPAAVSPTAEPTDTAEPTETAEADETAEPDGDLRADETRRADETSEPTRPPSRRDRGAHGDGRADRDRRADRRRAEPTATAEPTRQPSRPTTTATNSGPAMAATTTAAPAAATTAATAVAMTTAAPAAATTAAATVAAATTTDRPVQRPRAMRARTHGRWLGSTSLIMEASRASASSPDDHANRRSRPISLASTTTGPDDQHD